MNTMQVIQQMNDSIANDKAAVIRISRELAACRAAHPHLKGCALSQNAKRITAREEQLADLTYLLELYKREDYATCEVKAALEAVAQ